MKAGALSISPLPTHAAVTAPADEPTRALRQTPAQPRPIRNIGRRI
jgi:hypothetical protein